MTRQREPRTYNGALVASAIIAALVVFFVVANLVVR